VKTNSPQRPAHAFSLIEVMIAIGVLFICIFAILGVISNGLRGARALQRPDVDAGSVAAFFSITNKHEEGIESGSFDDLGDLAGPTTIIPGNANAWKSARTGCGRKRSS